MNQSINTDSNNSKEPQQNLQNERSPSEDSDMYPHPYILINTKMISSKKEKECKTNFVWTKGRTD